VTIRNAEQAAAHGHRAMPGEGYYCQACGRAIAWIVGKVCGFCEAAQKNRPDRPRRPGYASTRKRG
jgi:hypothetical protein